MYQPEVLDPAVDFLKELASDGGLQTSSAPYRYVWPAELDLMARICDGLLCEAYPGMRGARISYLLELCQR